MNPSVLCYYTGINYNYLLIYVLISFAIAGIFGISFREIISYFKNKIYLLFIFFNALGLTGFVLMLFVQGPFLMLLFISANISLFIGLSITFYLFREVKWSFIIVFTPTYLIYAAIAFSGVAYFYAIALICQLIAVLLLKVILKGGEI